MAIGYQRKERLRRQRPGRVFDTRDIRARIDWIDNLPDGEYERHSAERTGLVAWLNEILHGADRY